MSSESPINIMALKYALRSLLLIAGLAAALEVELNEKPDNQQACQGMYSAKSWGGNVEPYLMATFLGYKDQGEVSFIRPDANLPAVAGSFE